MKLKIAKDYSKHPGPRYRNEGDWSGEQFREELLWPRVQEAIQKGEGLEVDLDGTAGYGTSFLEESFGGLIREHGLTYADTRILTFVSREEDYLPADIEGYMKDAADKKH